MVLFRICRRLWPTVLLALGLAAAILTLGGAPAHAAGDQIDKYDISYRVDTDGVLHVTERITYRFDGTGRHGIERVIVTREPDGADHDVVYEVSEPRVSSPDGVPVDLDVDTQRHDGNRLEYTRFRIGDPDSTLDVPVATYVLEYTVEGAIRSSGGYDELYWDATGFDWDATMANVSIDVEVPGSAQDVACYAGSSGSRKQCEVAGVTDDGVARFGQAGLGYSDGITIGVKIQSGLVADNQPHRVDAATSDGEMALVAGIALAGLATVGAPMVAVIKIRNVGRDQRYLDLPPGALPARGEDARAGVSPSGVEIPVRFEPPDFPVALAGILDTGQVRPRDAAATLVSLAVRGAIKIIPTEGGLLKRHRYKLQLIDATRADESVEQALLRGLFGKKGDGGYRWEDARKDGAKRPPSVPFSRKNSFRNGYSRFETSVRRSAGGRRWFDELPKASRAGRGWIVASVIGALLVLAALMPDLWPIALLGVPVLVIGLLVGLVGPRIRRGARTARGRAYLDQLEGFRKYLKTAEADQLRFEEGEDIFAKFLPWAIAFGVADRWAKVCATLMEQGRLPDTPRDWYTGGQPVTTFNAALFSSGFSHVASPASATGSGTGTGTGTSSSSFSGGGGFAGGGGGGGGGGSW